MTFGNIKKGDTVYAVEQLGKNREHVTECEVLSVGNRWITVQLGEYHKAKFDSETGAGEYDEHVHTKATLKDARERLALLSRINPTHWGGQTTEVLRAVVAALDSDNKELDAKIAKLIAKRNQIDNELNELRGKP